MYFTSSGQKGLEWPVKSKWMLTFNWRKQEDGRNGFESGPMLYLVTGITRHPKPFSYVCACMDISLGTTKSFIKDSRFQRCYWDPHIV